MNYNLHYEKLIQRAKYRILDGKKEIHHVIPKCIGGTDDKSNLVELTPEEHYTAHLLLTRIYPNNGKLINAAAMMISGRPSNKLYGWLRRRFQDRQSELQTGEGNSQFGTMWIFNLELEECKKVIMSNHIPYGWQKGRVLNFISYKNDLIMKEQKNILHSQEKEFLLKYQQENKFKKQQEKEIIKKEYKEYILGLYEEFRVGNYYSISEFHKLNNVKVSRMTLSNYWRKWVPEYKENSKEAKRYRL
jgi:hypothetical protein